MSDNINDGLKKVWYTGVGLAAVSVDAVGKAIETLAAKGEEAVQKSKVMNEELKRKRAAAKASIQEIMDALEKMTQEEIELIRAKLGEIEKAMEEAGREVKMNADSVAERLEEMGREEIGAIRAKLDEIRQNWTDDHDKGEQG
jgi:polyhydroxyalkanoate synthesis regulator phasin